MLTLFVSSSLVNYVVYINVLGVCLVYFDFGFNLIYGILFLVVFDM